MEVVYINIFLLLVKDSTRKQTQKQMNGSQVVNDMGFHRVHAYIVSCICSALV